MNTNASATSAVSNLPAAPIDARRLFDWDHDASGPPTREFVGTERQASGFTVSIDGVQSGTGAVHRRASVWRSGRDAQLESEALRQLASAINAAAAEIDSLR